MRRLATTAVAALLCVVGAARVAPSSTSAPSAATLPLISLPANVCQTNQVVAGTVSLCSTTTVAPTTTVKATTTVPAATTTSTSAPTTSSSTSTTSTTMVMPTTTQPAPTTSVAPASTTTIVDAPGGFAAHFDSNESLSQAGFNYGVFRRDAYEVEQTSWMGDHDMSMPCGSPATHRVITADRPLDDFYTCAGHSMASEGDTSGYSLLYITPAQTFNTISSVCMKINLTDLGPREWWSMFLMPAGHTPLVSDAGSFSTSPPIGTLYTNAGTFSNVTATASDPSMDVVTWSGPNGYPGLLNIDGDHNGYQGTSFTAHKVNAAGQIDDTNGTPDLKHRYPVCMTDDKHGRLTFSITDDMVVPNVVYSQSTAGQFGPGPMQAVIAFHYYHPLKDIPDRPFISNTWHVDDVVVTP
jgi:hypothetical protein